MSCRIVLLFLLAVGISAPGLVAQAPKLTAHCSPATGSAFTLDLHASIPSNLEQMSKQVSGSAAKTGVSSNASSKASVPLRYGLLRSRSAAGNAVTRLEVAPECGAPPPVTTFPVEYRALIPYDNVTGNASGFCYLIYGDITGTYAGDIPHGTSAEYPTSYRASLYDLVDVGAGGGPDTIPDTGITTAFEPPSPVNGSYLTPPDWDGTLADCIRETGQNQAHFGVSPNWYTTGLLTYSSASASIDMSGEVSNPLSFSALTIGWGVSTTLANDTANRTLNITVSGAVTCFPESIVLVDGQQVAAYVPPTENYFYVGYCLATPATSPLTGPATNLPGGYNLSY